MVSVLTNKFGDWHRASPLIDHPFPSFEKEGFVFSREDAKAQRRTCQLVILNSFEDPVRWCINLERF